MSRKRKPPEDPAPQGWGASVKSATRRSRAMPSVRVFPNSCNDRLHYRANLIARDGVNDSAEGNFCFHLRIPITPCGAD